MSLSFGTRLGAYEILTLIGAGGMGEVYRATDTKLGRDVALKILPASVTDDPERIARFRREAQVLASLNHPHIAAIYGFDDSGETHALVLELVDGPTLADRIAKGPVPPEEALQIARQIADAVETAHEQGIIHRDLKPSNIKVRDDGTVKVLDFGLAKALEPSDPSRLAGGAVGVTQSPTITTPAMMTGIGTILGTAAYMSPEQAKGRAADKRSDVWAFGCVLYEMLTGARAFHAHEVTETLAYVLTREPDWSALPSSTTAAVKRLLRRCLEKDRKRRLHDIGDARLELEELLSGGDSEDRQQGRRSTGRGRWFWPLAVTGIVVAVAIVSAAAAWYVARRDLPGPRPLKRFAIDMRATPLNTSLAPFALSPDGTKLAYTSGSYEGSQLYVREFDQRDPRLLPGTTSAFNPFFSADGQWIGFSASTGLKKVPASGGPVIPLTSTRGARLGGACCGADGTIIFARGESGGLWKISSDGGSPQSITELDATQGEIGHIWPDLLPGGKAILFTVLTSTAPDAYRVAVQSLDSKTHRILVEGASFARYAPTGHLIYAQAGTLFAAPFELARLAITGRAVSVLDRISMDAGRGNARFSFSNDGTLAFVEATQVDGRSLVWVDRRGVATPFNTAHRGFNHPSVSPDGKRLVVEVGDLPKRDLWLYTFATGTFTRLTLDGAAAFPVWTPDGKKVTFATTVAGKASIVLQDVDGLQAIEPLVATSNDGYGVWPGSWTPDGQTLALMEGSPASGGDISVLNRRLNPGAQPFIHTSATEWGAKLSPDGRWMAYISNESGQWEVYVQPFPGPGNRRQISSGGGTEIVWARSGRELFYRSGQRIMSVPFTTNPIFSIGNPELLFEGPYLLGSPGAHNYDVTPDGQRFLMIKASEPEGSLGIQILTNWFDDVKARVPTK
jgi:Tol biopolymer transport system component